MGDSVTYQPTPVYTPGRIASLATTNEGVIKNSTCRLGFMTISNGTSSPRYVKLYNKATAPVLASDTPVLVIAVPGGDYGAGTNLPIPANGLAFTNGLAIAITGGIGDTDATAVGANEVVVNYGVK